MCTNWCILYKISDRLVRPEGLVFFISVSNDGKIQYLLKESSIQVINQEYSLLVTEWITCYFTSYNLRVIFKKTLWKEMNSCFLPILVCIGNYAGDNEKGKSKKVGDECDSGDHQCISKDSRKQEAKRDITKHDFYLAVRKTLSVAKSSEL